ncbi:MAG: sigma-54-dependent transcriptional regulator, partial [Planctomycetota bacterium]
MSRAAVLVVDDERDLAESTAYFLERAGFAAECATSAADALAAMQRQPYAVVVTDVRMPKMSGAALLTAIKQRDPDVEVLLMTGHPDLQAAVAAIKQGAFDYLAKPFGEKELVERVTKAAAHRQVRDRNEGLRERLRSGKAGLQLVHASPAFGAARDMLERAARTDASVLLLGESGSGKELLAPRLHDASARADK